MQRTNAHAVKDEAAHRRSAIQLRERQEIAAIFGKNICEL